VEVAQRLPVRGDAAAGEESLLQRRVAGDAVLWQGGLVGEEEVARQFLDLPLHVGAVRVEELALPPRQRGAEAVVALDDAVDEARLMLVEEMGEEVARGHGEG